MLTHWNDRCLPPWDAEDLKTKVINAYKFASGNVGAAHPAATFDVVPGAQKPTAAPIKWVTQGPSKKVVKCLQNCMNYLRLPAGGLHKIFAMNDLTGRIEFVLPAPWHNKKMPAACGVGDHDLQLLRGYLATEHHYESGPKDIEDAITNIAYHDRFPPVREYLESLTWDGKDDEGNSQCGPPLEADGVVLTPDEILKRFDECKLMDETPSLDLKNVMISCEGNLNSVFIFSKTQESCEAIKPQ